ncbi:putative MATE family efflux protein [Lachnotalea glycerini]|uniref:Putative MATE family efflux protein n=1 Tax=Lachnotalea glycerini TaxID=1763509 RepID=A0A318ERK4_9FIRM|nr:MATE family efflux transporter [Lachnotalea glycerini]PXV85587.1 putative MATE family efflux protein [Lachnotalea glycerini]
MNQTKDLDILRSNAYIFKMSIPIFIELLLQLLVGNIDQIMISRYSANSVAAIVNGNQIINIIIIVLNMMTMASTVILSQYLGANDYEHCNQTCTVSITIITIISGIATFIILFFYHDIFHAMHISSDILEESATYLCIVGGFTLIQGLYLNFAALLRGYTYMKQVMYISIFMNILNIIGNAILINGLFFFPQLGIMGAAISTVISKTIGLLLITFVFFKKTKVSINWGYLKHNSLQTFKKILLIGFPSGTESLSYQMSQICILGIINSFGTVAIVTKGYSSILANFSYVYAIAIAQATQIIVGYLLGSKRISDLEKRVWDTLKIAVGCCVGLSILLYLGSDTIFQIFNPSKEVLKLGKHLLFIEIFLEIGRAMNIVMTRMLICVGDVKTPMFFGISGHWLLAFLLSYVLGVKLELGLEGIWIAMAIDECTRGFIYLYTFKKNKWKKAFHFT